MKIKVDPATDTADERLVRNSQIVQALINEIDTLKDQVYELESRLNRAEDPSYY